MADHKALGAVNSILPDTDISASDLYTLFEFPCDDTARGANPVVALTFARPPEE